LKFTEVIIPLTVAYESKTLIKAQRNCNKTGLQTFKIWKVDTNRERVH